MYVCRVPPTYLLSLTRPSCVMCVMLQQNHIFPLVAQAMEFDPQLREQAAYSASFAPQGPQCAIGEGFGSELVAEMVLKLYRVKLLKDVMMRPLLDETGSGALTGVLHTLTAGVCSEVIR